MTEQSELADKLAARLLGRRSVTVGPGLREEIEAAVAALRAVPAQEPVAWRYRWHAPDDALWESVTDKTMLPTDPIGWDIEPLYSAPVPPANIAEDCAKIAEDHVGACSCTSDDTPGRYARSGYDEACRDIAKAIRDTHGVDVDAATGTADDQDFR